MQIFKFAHGLTCVDLVQIHMDRTLQLFDIRRQPLLVLDKVKTNKTVDNCLQPGSTHSYKYKYKYQYKYMYDFLAG